MSEVFVPHDYQRMAIDKIKRCRSVALLLDCGLGKTPIILNSIVEMGLKNVLVIAPKNVAETVWEQEARKWKQTEHLKFARVLGNQKQRLAALREKDVDIYLISRDNLVWFKNLEQPRIHLDRFSMIVIDESSSFKNPEAKRTMALYDLPHPRKVILTATPAPKNLLDLFSQYKILDCGWSLGDNYYEFRGQYFYDKNGGFGKYKNWQPVKGAEQEIFRLIDPITLSMRSKDLLHLPPKIDLVNTVCLSEGERAAYNKLKKECILKFIESADPERNIREVVAKNSGVLTMKLTQFANGFVYSKDKGTNEFHVTDIHQRKLDALEAILEACNNECVLVAYQFTHDAERLAELATKMGLNWLNLKEPKNVLKLQNEGCDVAFLHPKSAGFGLNLQGASHRLVWYSLPWSYEEAEQTLKRVYRQGQKETTYIHTLLCKDSKDEDIVQALSCKEGFNERLKEQTLAYVVNEVGLSVNDIKENTKMITLKERI